MSTGTVDTQRRLDDQHLALFGYRREFRRVFTKFGAFGISFSIIGLFPSIASVLGYAIPNGGTASMVWGWLTASVFILAIGLAMAELASAIPTSGGLYFWTYQYASPQWRKPLAWAVGYCNTIGCIAAVASIDWGCATQIMAAATLTNPSFSPAVGETFAVYLAVVISHALLCCFKTSVLAHLQNAYVILNIALCLGILIAVPIATPKEYHNKASYALGEFTNLDGWPNGFAFILSWMSPVWTICSFDASVHISEEVVSAATAVPWGIVLAVSTSGVLGTAILITLSFFMGTDMEAIANNPIGQPMATILFNSLGKKTTLAFWVIMVTVQYMMGSSMLLAASRQTFAFARDGALPFSTYLYRLNSFTEAPVNTVWFSAVGAILLGLLAFAGPAAIDAVFALSVVGLYVAYSIPIICRFCAPPDTFRRGPFHLGRWGRPVAVVAVLFMALISVIFLFPSRPQTNRTDMNYTIVVMGVVLLLSFAWYYVHGKNEFQGPRSTTTTRLLPPRQGQGQT
ncbi:amino acid/polyamine transporter I [Cantharellus anzutake]|uniref:amino acid/polyamine transporter I n=1 Tax=Cantharellus anzutake TaxID=1750568 RepID=UPI0019066504|nr:amino acid/polyamine transporter I [Cantharellus anzutake]KAF8339823.1 amino acid/polyamine transporter I [Cantharellus anzutake]